MILSGTASEAGGGGYAKMSCLLLIPSFRISPRLVLPSPRRNGKNSPSMIALTLYATIMLNIIES
jgi:hypothetical protein